MNENTTALATKEDANIAECQRNMCAVKLVRSNKKIQDGLAKETASTGTPMKKLSGGAKFTAQLSNIGGGSKATGGGGIAEGFNQIAQNVALKATINALEQESCHDKLED